ncbi:hypothetical protein [Candidatus Odyssella thessalonicensis]|uniref:hypothetical protein n=1 Tax=Candidatus Odyssella thessalonicensis TaxID=84647 RepID=UPI000225AEE0|nr:hypothetical protein [Candidatus Odyssella thessalonicensis]
MPIFELNMSADTQAKQVIINAQKSSALWKARKNDRDFKMSLSGHQRSKWPTLRPNRKCSSAIFPNFMTSYPIWRDLFRYSEFLRPTVKHSLCSNSTAARGKQLQMHKRLYDLCFRPTSPTIFCGVFYATNVIV